MSFKIQDVIDLARQVGDDILLANWGKVVEETKSDGTPVSFVDKESSRIIIEGLRALTPDIPVVSEEATREENIEALKGARQWIIDPLDGTSSYLEGPDYLDGQAGFGVHIAYMEDGKPVKGVVYLPAQNTMFFVGDDGKAYIQEEDSQPEVIEAPKSVQGALVAAVPGTESKRPKDINGLAYEPLTTIGGSRLCEVACGEADIMWNDRPDKTEALEDRDVFSYWDIAAGHAILKAAGADLYEIATGQEVSYNNESFLVRPCVAATPEILKHVGFFFDHDLDARLQI